MAKRFTTLIKINLGCCDLPLEGWINIDESTSPHIKADLVANALDLSAHFKPESVDEIYAGHLLEHLYPDQANSAILHWKSLLKPGGKLGIVTPDFKYICEQYLSGAVDLYEVNNLYLYSYVQESGHKWMWDLPSLMQLLEIHGFNNIRPIDKMNDEKLAYKVEWQTGAEGTR